MSGDESSVIRSGVEVMQQTAAPGSSSRPADISVPQYATSGTAPPIFQEQESTIIDAEVQLATPLADPPIEPYNTGDDEKRPPSSRSGRLKYMAIALFLIAGVMAGILVTLLLSPSTGNVNETVLIVLEGTTRPSSSFSPSSSPSGGPSRAPNTPTAMTTISSAPPPSQSPTGTPTQRNLMPDVYGGANPYFVQPHFQQFVEETRANDMNADAFASQYNELLNRSTGYWIDTRAKADSVEFQEMLQKAAAQNELVTLVVYSENVSYETCDFEQEYRPYIDAISNSVKLYPSLYVAFVVEPNALPSLATNSGMNGCSSAVTRDTYTKGIPYAVSALSGLRRSVYLDAGHGGWLGWNNGVKDMLDLVQDMDIIHLLRGFSINVSAYNPLGDPCPDDTDGAYCSTDSSHVCCNDPCGLLAGGNSANNEHNYARILRSKSKSILDWEPFMLIDTSRNGNPSARDNCANWCNIRDAKLGLPPTSSTLDDEVVDAYFWVKPPGVSDGCSELLPEGIGKDEFYSSNDICPSFNDMCASSDSIGSTAGDPFSPEAGQLFTSQLRMLMGQGDPFPGYCQKNGAWYDVFWEGDLFSNPREGYEVCTNFCNEYAGQGFVGMTVKYNLGQCKCYFDDNTLPNPIPSGASSASDRISVGPVTNGSGDSGEECFPNLNYYPSKREMV